MSVKYLVQKAVEFAAMTQKAKKERRITNIEELDDRYIAQRKYDGCNAIVRLMPGGGDMLSRTGEIVKSCDHIVSHVRSLLRSRLTKGESFAVLGEVWQRKTPQPRISGDFRKGEARPSLQFAVFDIHPLERFTEGRNPVPFVDRHAYLYHYFRGFTQADPVFLAETYNPGTYGSAQEMCDSLVEQGGYDGLILREPNGPWTAGSGTTGEIIKVKNSVTLDLEVTGVEEGEGKYEGMLGALLLRGPQGVTVKVSGMTDAQRRAWWDNPASIVGSIVEVRCLEILPSGSLREPRFKGIRYDKEQADF